MVIVIAMGVMMIWGCIYLLAAVFNGASNHQGNGNIAMIVVDILVVILFASCAGGAGLLFAILFILVINACISDGMNKTANSDTIRRENMRTAMEDKDHNDNGWIEWKYKDE